MMIQIMPIFKTKGKYKSGDELNKASINLTLSKNQLKKENKLQTFHEGSKATSFNLWWLHFIFMFTKSSSWAVCIQLY
jgi:hypothetical protein